MKLACPSKNDDSVHSGVWMMRGSDMSLKQITKKSAVTI